MRILQIVPSVSLVYGGPSQMVLGLSAALAKLGVDLTLITTDSNGDAGQAPLEVPLGEIIEQNGYKIIYFRCSPFRRYKFSFGLLRWLLDNAQQYDLAHIHALFSPVTTAAATIARSKSLPYIIRPLGTLDPADLQKKKNLKQIYGQLLEKPNLAGAAAIHFTSSTECEISERFGATTKDLVIPLGVNLPQNLPEIGKALQKLAINSDLPLILFMSRIDRKKGLNLLIPALEKLLAAGDRFHFVLAGTNPQDPNYENQIREQIENSPLAKNTTIAGFVTGEFKLELLKDADLFVLPSYYENFGIAVVEAMAIETPVIISDRVHIWQEIKAAEAGWITTTEVDSLTACLKLALQNPKKIEERGLNAIKLTKEKYSWEAIASRVIEAYQGIIQSK